MESKVKFAISHLSLSNGWPGDGKKLEDIKGKY